MWQLLLLEGRWRGERQMPVRWGERAEHGDTDCEGSAFFAGLSLPFLLILRGDVRQELGAMGRAAQ